MRWPWQRRQENHTKNVQAVRIETRAHLDNELGDIEFNRRRAEELRRNAQRNDG